MELLTNDLSSRIYTLLVFQPLSLKKLALILYSDENKKSKINSYLKILIKGNYIEEYNINDKIKYLRDIKSAKEIAKKNRIDPKEKFYKANLKLILDCWRQLFYKNKPNDSKSKFKKMVKDVIPIINGDETTWFTEYISIPKKEQKQLEVDFKKIKPISEEEFKILEKFFFEKNVFDKTFFNFKHYGIFSLIRDRNIKFNALELFTNIFYQFLNRSYKLHMLQKISSVPNLEEKVKEGIADLYLRIPKSPLDSETIRLAEKIESSRLEEIISILSILLERAPSMQDMSKMIYGFTIDVIE